MGALLAWLAAHGAAIAAISTAALAIYLGVKYLDRRRKKLPFVAYRIDSGARSGWARLDLVVRNPHPYAVAVVELRVQQPRESVLFSESDAFDDSGGDQPPVFVATATTPRLVSPINVTLEPTGTPSQYLESGSTTISAEAELYRTFFYSPGPGRREAKVIMRLICETMSGKVRRHEIPIESTVTLRREIETGSPQSR